MSLQKSVFQSGLQIIKPMVVQLLGLTNKLIHSVTSKNSLSVFCYHDVSFEPSEFCRRHNLSITPDVFEFQIDFIRKHFNIICPKDLIKSELPDKAALITFDDGFHSIFKTAVPIMKSKQIPSLIFLNMAPIKGEVFWAGLIDYLCDNDQRFVNYLRRNRPVSSFNHFEYLSCSKKVVNSYLEDTGLNIANKIKGYSGVFAQEEDLYAESENELLFYGNHLYNHYVSLTMTDQEFLDEFDKNKRMLEKYPNFINAFSFPFGQPNTCFDDHHIELLSKRSVHRVFYSSGKNNRTNSSYCLDRLALNSFHNSHNKIWFQMR